MMYSSIFQVGKGVHYDNGDVSAAERSRWNRYLSDKYRAVNADNVVDYFSDAHAKNSELLKEYAKAVFIARRVDAMMSPSYTDVSNDTKLTDEVKRALLDTEEQLNRRLRPGSDSD